MICMTVFEHVILYILHTWMILWYDAWHIAWGWVYIDWRKCIVLAALLQILFSAATGAILECRDGWVDFIPTWSVGLDRVECRRWMGRIFCLHSALITVTALIMVTVLITAIATISVMDQGPNWYWTVTDMGLGQTVLFTVVYYWD